MGPRKEAKDLRKGGSWELLFSTTPNSKWHGGTGILKLDVQFFFELAGSEPTTCMESKGKPPFPREQRPYPY